MPSRAPSVTGPVLDALAAQGPPAGPLVFSLPRHAAVLTGPAGGRELAARGQFELRRFSNGELYVRLADAVAGRVCGVLGSLAPPDEQMLAVLMLADTLRREGAREVVALLPYLGYARQDRADPGQSLGLRLAGDLLHAAGVGRVLTVDVHSAEAERLAVPLESLSPAGLFANVLSGLGAEGQTVVAPDAGALERCADVRRAAAIRAPLAHMRKRRDAAGVTHSALVGAVGSRAAVVDDILDTGGTLLSACAELRRAGVQEIVVLATHGLFTGERWRELPELGVRRIYTTDSVPAAKAHAGELVRVLGVGGLIARRFAAVAARAGAGPLERSDPALVELIEGPAPAEDSSIP